jgi:uncharacterized membrane protein
MEGDLDPFDFLLAEHLHRTLAELQSMTTREYLAWRAFFVWRKVQQELA